MFSRNSGISLITKYMTRLYEAIEDAMPSFLKKNNNKELFRLSATPLFQIVKSAAITYNSDVDYDKTDLNSIASLNYNDTHFYLFPICRDVEMPRENIPSPFILNKLKKFFSEIDFKHQSVLLIPYLLCGNYLWTKERQHVVLLEIDLIKKTINIHDSQGKLRYWIYQDTIKPFLPTLNKLLFDKIGANLVYSKYNAYNVQCDDFSCGYYCIQYIKHRIEHYKDSDNCKAVGYFDMTYADLQIAERYENVHEYAELEYNVINGEYQGMRKRPAAENSANQPEEINFEAVMAEFHDIDPPPDAVANDFEHLSLSESQEKTASPVDSLSFSSLPATPATTPKLARSNSLSRSNSLFGFYELKSSCSKDNLQTSENSMEEKKSTRPVRA